MHFRSSSGTVATTRRGMLLLLVLSILALFIVVGGVGILLAIRAREAARAFAAATNATSAGSASLARAQLDEALLRLIRGTNPVGGAVTETLLADKYGTSQSCQVSGLSGAAAAIITGTVTGLDLSNPALVAGRVLTFVPAASDPTGPTSYRILRVDATAGTVLLANVKPTTPLPLPTVFPCEAVINGREFSGTQPDDKHEPYDAFDDQNPFLTQVVLRSSTVASVARPAFGAANAPCTVDNDGDGVPDGVWLQDALPRQRTSSGGDLKFDVSYLVLDLDGRINLNAHGSVVRAQLPRDTTQYSKDPVTFPVGMGFGPADVDAALAFGGQAAGSGTNRWAIVLQGGAVTQAATTSSATQWRPTPLVEASQQGRYTQGTTYSGAAPGNESLTTGTSPVNADFWFVNATTGTANSPTDLKARLQVFTDGGSPPSLRFCRPAGAVAWAVGDTEDLRSTGAAAHPYALRLDDDAPRAAGGNAVDAPYTVAELERILRQFDADAATLAPRLAAMLDDLAERSRMTVTTESWDTPAITGTAVTQTRTAVTGGNPYDVLSPETVAGLRFNLNRPFASTAARQEYFKQLYTLCVALGAPVADAAQWAANVIEFRDPDSTIGWYPYDPTPLDGVWTTGTGVWGMERPELVITSATATGSQVAVSLYRPWNAQLCTGPAPTVSGTTERIAGSLGNATANTLNAAATGVWRLSVTWVAGGTTAPLATILTTATAIATNTGTTATVTTSGTATEVVLQRLADPTRALGGNLLGTGAGKNAYVDIHRLTIPASGTAPSRAVSRWLHWPNRDLVSHGELLAVQSGSSGLPEAMFDETNEASLARAYPAILDATIVPSRFAAANVFSGTGTVASTYLAGTGYENFQYGQFSRWREAGRVNVNTILTNTSSPPTALDNAVWTAVLGRSGVPNPVAAAPAYAPIKADRDLLVVGGDAAFPRSTPDAASAFLKRATAIRLANVATTRSHVFAVWITLRITDTSANGGSPQFARLFAIVDRSIPVGYAPGRNLNVRETIRLQRFLP